MRTSIAMLCVLLLSSSCRRDIIYERFQVVGTVWYQDTGLTYFYNVPDVSVPYDLTLEIRHNGTYPYRNIWIFSQEERPIDLVYRDTLECELADVEGSWLGRGYSIRTLSVPLRRGHIYPMGGRYVLTLYHGMRDEPLVGIESIGLKITYAQ